MSGAQASLYHGAKAFPRPDKTLYKDGLQLKPAMTIESLLSLSGTVCNAGRTNAGSFGRQNWYCKIPGRNIRSLNDSGTSRILCSGTKHGISTGRGGAIVEIGYTTIPPMRSAKPNAEFHGLFTQFINSVAEFWRDKRISDVIREHAYDSSFGSIAAVRRAGLDLRNTLKWSSYGRVNIFRIEVLQLLDEAFKILGAEDIKKLFGADNVWDVIEEVMLRYFKQQNT